jgi:hypothetical protein
MSDFHSISIDVSISINVETSIDDSPIAFP